MLRRWSEGGSGRAGQEVVQQWVTAGHPAVVALLPLESVVQLLHGAVTQPHALQQHAVCPGLLQGGVQRLIVGGGGVSGRLLP